MRLSPSPFATSASCRRDAQPCRPLHDFYTNPGTHVNGPESTRDIGRHGATNNIGTPPPSLRHSIGDNHMTRLLLTVAILTLGLPAAATAATRPLPGDPRNCYGVGVPAECALVNAAGAVQYSIGQGQIQCASTITRPLVLVFRCSYKSAARTATAVVTYRKGRTRWTRIVTQIAS